MKFAFARAAMLAVSAGLALYVVSEPPSKEDGTCRGQASRFSQAGRFTAGSYALTQGDWKCAADFLTQAAKAAPDHPLVLRKALIATMSADRTNDALRIARQLKSVDPENVLAGTLLAARAARQSLPDDVFRYLENNDADTLKIQIAALEPETRDREQLVRTLLADILLKKGRYFAVMYEDKGPEARFYSRVADFARSPEPDIPFYAMPVLP